MAHNYHQPPYYGAPLHYPPPPMQQQAQNPYASVDAQSGHPPMPQLPPPPPPVPGGFQHLPGLQPPPHASSPSSMIPSAYSANVQHPPFPPPGGWPTDPNALFAFMHSVSQNGQLPPPPLPGFPFPPPSLPHTPQLPHTPTQFAPQPYPPIPPHERVKEIMNGDKEDGELSEGDVSSKQPTAGLAARPQIEASRSAPRAARAPLPVEDAYNPDQPAAGQAVAKPPPRQPQRLPQPVVSHSPLEALQQSRDQAKQFVKLLHSNNIGYHALANENLDLELLRGLYSSLNLPSEPAPIPSRKATVAASDVSPAPGAPPKISSPAIKTGVAAPPAVKPAQPPGDRKEYIARLQAAKLAAKSGGTKPASPQPLTPTSTKPPATSTQTQSAAATPTAKAPLTQEQKARQTEIIKQRLEELKAKGQSKSKINGTVTELHHPPQPEQVQFSAAKPAAQLFPSEMRTPASEQSATSFSAIPGLFMGTPYNSATPAASITKPSVPQKRPAPSDSTGPSTPRGSVTPYTRPLGDSPHVYHEESIIIEVSDDESNGSAMDIDDEETGTKTAIVTPSAAAKTRPNPGNIPNFHSQPASVVPGSSAASTPGTQTPVTLAREEELRRKEDELVAMRQKLRQKIADRIAKEKAEKAGKGAVELPTPTGTPSSLTTRSKAPENTHQNQRSIDHSALSDNADTGRDIKRRRREEIQSKLTTVDAEIASGNEKIARLMRELDDLKAANERVARDKQQLVEELEELGVDTDGMSHAEMRAKRTEIEREMTPVPEVTSQNTGVSQPVSATQSLTDHQQESTATATVQAIEHNALAASNATALPPAGLPGLTMYVTSGEDTPARPSQASTVDEHLLQGKVTSSPLQGGPMISKDVGKLASEKASNNFEVPRGPTPQDSATPEDTDDFYSPPRGEPGTDEGTKSAVAVQKNLASEQPGEGPNSDEGEVEMSESSADEEEYEPEEPMAIDAGSYHEVQVAGRQSEQSHNTSDVSTEDEEAYEPPEADENLYNAHMEADSGPVVHEAHAELDDGAMDLASSSLDSDSSGSDSDSDSDAESAIPASQHLQPQANIADDLAPELQRSTAVAEDISADEEDEAIKFTPYESPLRMFKSYRYHPNFATDIAGGFMSPTFSHQIDPEQPFCQYELAGGSCNDSECPFQHFRGIGLTGETLLVQLGTANPGKTPEERQQWNDGLRGVLKELRKKNIKDPNGIAAEIAKYRRQFLNDNTRVVNL